MRHLCFILCIAMGFVACGKLQPGNLSSSKPQPGEGFKQWLRRVSSSMVTKLPQHELDRLTLDQSVLDLYNRQPETYTTFRGYYTQRVTERTSAAARSKGKSYGQTLRNIERQFGVPGELILAIWSVETALGGYRGNKQILRSLASLSYGITREPRRQFFFDQFVGAVELSVVRGIHPRRFLGSWAGAFGHMQFMPRTFQRFAVDGDGDGRIDHLQDAPADAFHSAANYLKLSGWQADQDWSIRLEVDRDNSNFFTYGRTTFKELAWHPLQQWIDWRVVDGTAIGNATRDTPAALLLPLGQYGPAYLLLPNALALKEYNNSVNYVLSVGALADAVRDPSTIITRWRSEIPERFQQGTMLRVQQTLKRLSYDPGEVDGKYGASTSSAVRMYQLDRNMVPDGYPSTPVIEAILQEYKFNFSTKASVVGELIK